MEVIWGLGEGGEMGATMKIFLILLLDIYIPLQIHKIICRNRVKACRKLCKFLGPIFGDHSLS